VGGALGPQVNILFASLPQVDTVVFVSSTTTSITFNSNSFSNFLRFLYDSNLQFIGDVVTNPTIYSKSSLVLTGLTAGTNYACRVFACNDYFLGSNFITVSMATLPEILNGTLTPLTTTSVRLSWERTTYVTINFLRNGSGFGVTATSPALSIVITGLSPASTYTFTLTPTGYGRTGTPLTIVGSTL
jgi:hypothetical protein